MIQPGTTATWRAIARGAGQDPHRPAFVRQLATTLGHERPRLDLPGGVTLGNLRAALGPLETVPTHRTTVDGARALLDADAWRAAESDTGVFLRETGLIGRGEHERHIGYVAVHLRDPTHPAPLATPLAASRYGDVRLWYAPETLHDMTFTARQHHEMRENDMVIRGTVENLHRVYAQRLVDWVARGGAVPEATPDALRGWMLLQDQHAPYLLEGQARGLNGRLGRTVELLPASPASIVDPDEAATRRAVAELVSTARERGIEVIDRRMADVAASR